MAIKYKGINISGLEFGSGKRAYYDYAVPGTEQYHYWGADVGASVVRIPFKWERLQTTSGGELNKEYLNYLQTAVANAKANGMTAILDLHNFGYYNDQLMTDSKALTDVWTKLGTIFKGDSKVWLNLMNEPFAQSAAQWESITQTTVNNLRAAGIDNKLLLSGTAWSGAHSWESSGNAAAYAGFKDPMKNYAYDVHQYLDKDYSGTTGVAVAGSGINTIKAITAWAEATGQQLFLGEVGAADPTVKGQELALTELNAMMNYMDQHSGAWLGAALWGAGPWWPDNYAFNINPTNINSTNPTNDPVIAKLMDWFHTLPAAVAPEIPLNVIDGTSAAETLSGTDANDRLTGKDGRDTLIGGKGNDILYGDNAPGDKAVAALLTSVKHDFSGGHKAFAAGRGILQNAKDMGLAKGDLAVADQTTVSVKLYQALSSYKSTVGVYTVAADGTIGNVSVLFKDTIGQQKGTVATIEYAGATGMSLGFFMVADGLVKNASYKSFDLTKLQFVYHLGKGDERPAHITDNAKDITLVDKSAGLAKTILGDIYHTNYHGEDAILNLDKMSHVQTGLADGKSDTLRIGFEDMKWGGDGDYNDIVLDVSLTSKIRDISHDDILNGGDGNDLIYGGIGYDILTGGSGQDTFLYTSMAERGDRITDFQSGSNGDIIKLAGVLEHYDALTSKIADFLHLTSNTDGSKTLSVNADGHAGGEYVALANINGLSSSDTVDTMMSQGNIVVA